MTDDQIKHMVDRFLGWRLPENFSPDAGISFERTYNEHTPYPMKHEPIGTNLFDAQQAEQMVRYMVEGMPCRPNPETQADHLAEYFQKLRFAPEHHFGGGDIRLTMAQQDEVVAMCRLGRSPVEAVPVSALRELEAEHRAQAAEGYRQADMQPQGSRMNLDMKMKAAVHLWSADRLSAVIRGTKT